MQIKYKEDRQTRTDQKNKKEDDASSQSYVSTDDEEEQEKQAPPFFIVDDFDTHLKNPGDQNTPAPPPPQPQPTLEFFKEDDFFLSTDWSLNDYQQTHAYL
jgi:hypothetical protein